MAKATHEHLLEIRCKKCNKLLVKKDPNQILSMKCTRCGELTPLMLDVNDKQMIVTDMDGRILYVNEFVLKASGYNITEVLGSKASLLWGRNTDANYYLEKRELITKTRGPIHLVVNNTTKGGVTYKTSMHISPVFGHDGNTLFYISIGENV